MHSKEYKEKRKIPYHHDYNSFIEHLENNSNSKNNGIITYTFKKIISHICESLAYNCPINSIRVWLHKIRGVHIGKNVFIGKHCILDHAFPEYIYLEDGCGLAGNIYILAHTNPSSQLKSVFDSYVAPVIVKENAWIGIRSTIMPGVTIGERAVISAGVVVNKDVPKNTLVYCNQNKNIKLTY